MSGLENIFQNVEVVEVFYEGLEIKQPDSLVIINFAEYMLTQKQLSKFIKDCNGTCVLNNVHLYNQDFMWFAYSIIKEISVFLRNLLTLTKVVSFRPLQFRGWWRTPNDFDIAAIENGKHIKAIIMTKNRERKLRFGTLYDSMIHYEYDV